MGHSWGPNQHSVIKEIHFLLGKTRRKALKVWVESGTFLNIFCIQRQIWGRC